ncbi:MAG: Hsp20/alpha crystallin family protein [Caldimonas sp.]
MYVLPVSRSAVFARRAVSPRFSSAIEQLFDESIDRFVGGSTDTPSTRTPAMDVTECDAAYTVVFDVPGVSREQLKVSVDGRRVSLSTEPVAVPVAEAVEGQAPTAEAAPAERVLYRERTAARFARTVSLPAEVDQTASQAKFDNGVLTLTLAKKVPAGAAQLHIA